MKVFVFLLNFVPQTHAYHLSKLWSPMPKIKPKTFRKDGKTIHQTEIKTDFSEFC